MFIVNQFPSSSLWSNRTTRLWVLLTEAHFCEETFWSLMEVFFHWYLIEYRYIPDGWGPRNISILYMSKDQLNQKLKLMVEAPGIYLYSITSPHARALWAWSVDAAHTWREIFHWERRGGWDSNPWPFCHAGSWYHVKDQLNQKLKLMVEAPGIYLYSINIE